MKTDPAWYVGAEDRGAVVYAPTYRKARAAGAAQIDRGYDEVTEVRRAPEYDRYAATGGPTTRQLVAGHGWHYECGGCCRTLRWDETAAGSDGGLAWDADGDPYCNAMCLAEFRRREARRERLAEQTEQRWALGLTPETDLATWAFVTRPRQPAT